MSLRKHFAQREAEKPALEYLDTQVPSPPPTVLIVPTPGPVQSAAKAYRDLEQNDLDTFRNDAEEASHGLTDVRNALDEANRNGGLATESVYFAGIATEAYLTRIGESTTSLTPAFESAMATPGGKSTVATGELTSALESVDSFHEEIAQRGVSTAVRALAPVWTLVKAKGLLLGLLLAKAKKIKPVSTKPTISFTKGDLLEGDSVPSNIASAFERAAADLVFLSRTFGVEALRDYQNNIQALKELGDKHTPPEEAVDNMGRVLSRWKDPRTKLRSGLQGKPYIGNYVIFRDQKLKYHGSNSTAKKFDEFANLKYPTTLVFQREDHPVADAHEHIDVPALTPAEIVHIGQLLKKACSEFGAMTALAETNEALGAGGRYLSIAPKGEFFASLFMKGKLTMPGIDVGLPKLSMPLMVLVYLLKAARRSKAYWDLRKTAARGGKRNGTDAAEALYALKDAVHTSHRLCFHVPYDAGNVLIHVMMTFERYAKLSLKAYADAQKAALEAYDSTTEVDGESTHDTAPNEPTQAPPVSNTAPEGEVVKPQTSINDDPRTVQDLAGTAADPIPATESLSDRSTGAKHTVVTSGKARPYWMK